MIAASNISLSYGKRVLFKDVNIKFTPGNCYGLIGANGAGKSTFLKILAGEIEADKGEIVMGPRERMAVLRQDQFAFDEETVFNTVIMGHETALQGHGRARGDLRQARFLRGGRDPFGRTGERIRRDERLRGRVGGGGAAQRPRHPRGAAPQKMKELEAGDKVRVLLAQALFGSPDILLLDEPTNNLDLKSISWLEDFLFRFPNTVIVVSHDRHFLNQVCTHTADIDFGRIRSMSATTTSGTMPAS